MKKNLQLSLLVILMITTTTTTSFLGSLIGSNFTSFKGKIFGSLNEYQIPPNSNKDDIFWAQQILGGNGRYILWFRHGEREKWTGTVTVFDYFDVNKNKNEIPSNWQPAVCLTPKGIAESQVVGKTFRALGVTVVNVITSPSCRAKQTALNAFGRVDQEWLEILHTTAIPIHQQKPMAERLKQKISSLSSTYLKDDGVIVVTGHGNTLPFYEKTLFIDSHVKNWAINELGFIIIEITPNGLIAQHSYVDFYQFANTVLEFTN